MRTACCKSVGAEKGLRPALKGAGVSAPWLLLLVPKFGCPLCWPLLAGVLGTFGLSIGALNGLLIATAAAALAVLALRGLMVPRKRLELSWLCLSCAPVFAYRLRGTGAAFGLLSVAILMMAITLFLLARRRAPQDAGACTISTQ